MVDEDTLSSVLSDFARTLITDFPIQGILDHLVERIVDVLSVSAAGVTLISPGMAPHYVAASNADALEFERLQTERQTLVEEKDSLEAVITAEWRQIDNEIARKEERKREALAPVPGDLVELYEKLRATKEGVAVGRLEQDTCGGCHIRLSPAEVLEAKESDPPRCVHCRRILVV